MVNQIENIPNQKQLGYLYGLLRDKDFKLLNKDLLTKESLSIIIDFLQNGKGGNLLTVKKHLEKRGTEKHIRTVQELLKDSPYYLINKFELDEQRVLSILEIVEFTEIQKEKVEFQMLGDYKSGEELEEMFDFETKHSNNPFHFLALKSGVPFGNEVTDKQWNLLRQLSEKNGYNIVSSSECYLDKDTARSIIMFFNGKGTIDEDVKELFLDKI